jgi:hypothetical protein
VYGKADHHVKEPQINIRIGKASKETFTFSNPNINTSIVGMDSLPDYFQIQIGNLLGWVYYRHFFQWARCYGIE